MTRGGGGVSIGYTTLVTSKAGLTKEESLHKSNLSKGVPLHTEINCGFYMFRTTCRSEL